MNTTLRRLKILARFYIIHNRLRTKTMFKVTRFCILVFCVFLISYGFSADKKDEALLSDKTFAGLKLRGIGPAFMSGRIADIAINPGDPSQWYVAVGSGGVWKTDNASTTWQPIFDDQPSLMSN